MSLAMKQSKANIGRSPQSGAMLSRRAYMGDPGLFGFLGKAASTIAKTLLPGPVRTGIDILTGSGGGPGGTILTKTSQPFQEVPRPAPINLPGPIGGPGVGFPNPFAQGGRTSFGENGRAVNGTGPAPSGYHWNKSDYFLKDGTFVPAGSRLVKNRRRNPLNPRAASRAISRLESAKKATKRLDRIAIKCRRCGYASCRCK